MSFSETYVTPHADPQTIIILRRIKRRQGFKERKIFHAGRPISDHPFSEPFPYLILILQIVSDNQPIFEAQRHSVTVSGNITIEGDISTLSSPRD